MRITVNHIEIELYNGATVADAVRNYYRRQTKKIPRTFPVVQDAYGNSVALDGALVDGNRLYIKQ